MVKYCRYCGAENDDDAWFCKNCKHSLIKYCPHCGAKNDQNALYCEKCGAKLKKGVGDILGDAIEVISGKPVILLPYIVLCVIAWIQVFKLVFLPTMSPWFSLNQRWNLVYDPSSMFFEYRILTFFVNIFAGAIAIVIAHIYTIKNKKPPLTQAFERVSSKAVPLLLLGILYEAMEFAGERLLPMGIIILIPIAMLFAFIYQGILIDDLGIIATIRNSYRLALNNLSDVFIAVIIIFFATMILNLLLFVGVFVACYSAVVFTLLYLDRQYYIGESK